MKELKAPWITRSEPSSSHDVTTATMYSDGVQPASCLVPVSLFCPVAFGTKGLREFLDAKTVESFVNILIRALN